MKGGVGQCFHLFHLTHAYGISKLIQKQLDTAVLHNKCDKEQRYFFIYCKMKGKLWISTTVYTTLIFSLDVILQLGKFISSNGDSAVMVRYQ